MSSGPALVWFRNDLRVSDNPALDAAAATGRPIIPLYVLDQTPGQRPLGGAQRWWLDGSLRALAGDLAKLGLTLALRRGPAAETVQEIVAAEGVQSVFWNRRYDLAGRERDKTLKADLKESGVAVESFNGALLTEPWELKTGSGGHFQVFTPFWRSLLATATIEAPSPVPTGPLAPARTIASEDLNGWGLTPTKPDWAGGLRAHWKPGSAGAVALLQEFLSNGLSGYSEGRNRPDLRFTSRLSPHLQWGEISPRQVWRAVKTHCAAHPEAEQDGMAYLRELGWRDFAHVLLFHAKSLVDEPIKPEYARFPWRSSAEGLEAWRRGRTGYPIVDAGMRELWHTGWMHNRVRMIAASFLIKDLLIDWREGEKWFWDALVDACPANNPASWQWVAGCGADAAPFFRIFNPTLQGAKFDPGGAYVRRWVPELAKLPTSAIHQPWSLDERQSRAVRFTLGRDYPKPIVDHGEARDRALAALASIKSAA